jgi:hypothetical protein
MASADLLVVRIPPVQYADLHSLLREVFSLDCVDPCRLHEVKSAVICKEFPLLFYIYKTTLLTVTVLLLFAFFNLILGATLTFFRVYFLLIGYISVPVFFIASFSINISSFFVIFLATIYIPFSPTNLSLLST